MTRGIHDIDPEMLLLSMMMKDGKKRRKLAKADTTMPSIFRKYIQQDQEMEQFKDYLKKRDKKEDKKSDPMMVALVLSIVQIPLMAVVGAWAWSILR